MRARVWAERAYGAAAPAVPGTLAFIVRGLIVFPLSPRPSPPPSRHPPVVPSTRVVAVKGKELKTGVHAFVAPTASIIGDVTLGEQSSVWYSAGVRGACPPLPCPCCSVLVCARAAVPSSFTLSWRGVLVPMILLSVLVRVCVRV